MVTHKRWNGSQWGEVTRKRWGGSAWLALSGGAGTPSPPPLTLDTLRQVTERASAGTEGQTVGSTTPLVTTARMTVRAESKDLRLVYGSVALSGDPGTATFTLASSVAVGGTTYPVTWAGAASKSIAPGAFVTSDPISNTFPAGTDLLVTTTRTPLASGNVIPRVAGDWGVAAFGDSVGIMALPLGVHGLAASSAVSVAVLGDSISEGGTDTYRNGVSATGGFIRRALEAEGIAYAHYGRWGESFKHMWNAGPTARANARYGPNGLAAATHALCEYGINDYTRTLTEVKLVALGYWNWVKTQNPSIKITQTTLAPLALSSDGFTTLTNQTIGNAGYETTRLATNAWFRDGAPIIAGVGAATGTTDPTAKRAGQAGHPLTSVLEVGDTVESSRDSGKWAVDQGSLTADGTHPNATGHIRMAVPVQAWAAGLTV